MKALIKLSLYLTGLLFILVIAVVVTLATLDPNDHKDWIIAKVQQQTGRTLALDGDIKLTFYPWLGLEANGVTLGNAAGFGDQPFFHTKHVKFRIKLLPILQKQYEVDTIHIDGAVINLAKNKQGVNNWDDLIGAEPKQQQPLPLAALVLGGVDIKDAKLTWQDDSTATRYEISRVNMSTGALVYGEPIDLSLSFNALANKPDIQVVAELTGTIAYDLDNERYSIKPLAFRASLKGKNIPGGETQVLLATAIEVNLAEDTATISGLSLDALGTQVLADIKVSKIQSATPSVQAELKIKAADIAQLFKIAEIEPLASQLAKLKNRQFELSTTLSADMARGDVDISELSASMLGASLNGKLKATNIHSDTPAFKAELNASGPDLSTLLRVAGQFERGENPKLATLGKQLAGLKDRKFVFKVVLDADLKRGDMDISRFSAKLLGASIQGRVKASSIQSETPSFQGSLQASGPDLPSLLQLAGQFQGGKDPVMAKYGKQLTAVSTKQKAFSVDVKFDVDLKSGDVELPKLSVKTLGLTVAGHLQAKGMQGKKGTVNGKLSVTGKDLSKVLLALDQKSLAEVLQSVSFETGINGNKRNLSLKPMTLKATLAGKQIPNSPVNLVLNANTQLDLEAEKLTLDDFSLTGLGLNIQGKVNASKIMQAPEFNGQLDIAPFNLRKLMRQFKQTPPVTADKKVLGKVALTTQFAGSTMHMKLNKLLFELDDTTLRGDLSVTDFANPAIQVSIDIDQINVDRYLPPPPKGKQNKAVTPEAAAGAAAQLPVEILRALNVKGNLSIGKLIISNARLANVKLSLNAKDGKIDLKPVTADLYQGKYSGSINLDATGKLPRLTINSSLKGIQIEPLLKDVTGEAKVRGTGNFSAALVAVGADSDALKKTLNGRMSFSFRDGAIKGYNLGKIMRQANSLKESFTLSVSDKEETDLSEITGNPVVKNGVIRLDDLSGKSPAIRLSGSGILADLPQNRMDYKITAQLVATSTGQGGKELAAGKLEGVPLDCRLKGPLDNPRRDCDASKLIAALGMKLIKGLLKLPGKAVPGGDQTQTQTTQTEQTTEQQQSAPRNPIKELEDTFKQLKSIFGK